jgi:2-polyprenyl-6-methoxyphenol hydroxylase-like FAD-dependent oxidoreductase
MANTLQTTCCIVGGGPAGVMLGYLLARRGVSVTILEKHKDFFRDFRGDTVHPSTLELMYEIGILDEFLGLPHQELRSISGVVGGYSFKVADFTHVPTHCKFVALMPQWEFLNFLSEQAKRFRSFDLRMEHEATDLFRENGKIAGVVAQTPHGPVQITADLVVACDGRHSTIRNTAKLPVTEFGVPMDVLWFRMGRRADDPEQLFGNINYGRALVLINRGDYFQAGLIIRKDSFEEIKTAGVEAFRDIVARIAPYLRNSVHELQDWNQIKLLSVKLNRLERWHEPGLLCIGDAAHAMSPAGGVGINLAIQDAVAAANLLADALREGRVTHGLLQRVQRRREFPTRMTQAAQANAHKIFAELFRNTGPLRAPWQLKAAVQVPGITHVIGRAIGVGPRPEHIQGTKRSPAYHRDRLVKIALGLGIVAGLVILCGIRLRPGRLKPGL